MNPFFFLNSPLVAVWMQNPFDFSKPLDKAVYSLATSVAQLIWIMDAAGLALAQMLLLLRGWLADGFLSLTDGIMGGFGQFLVAAGLFAALLYGIATVLNIFLPSFRPVDPGRAIMFFVLGVIYIGSAKEIIGGIENVREMIYASVSDASFDPIVSRFSTFPSSATPIDEMRGLDGNEDNLTGFDVAAAYLGVRERNELNIHQFPALLVEGYPYIPTNPDSSSGCCFAYALNPAGFDALNDNQRSHAIDQAYDGIGILLQGMIPTWLAVIEAATLLILTVAAYILYFTLPLAFIFAPFNVTAGILSGYINRFVSLLIEMLVTGLFLGLAIAIVGASLSLSLSYFLAATILAAFIAVWRWLSAIKLTFVAVNTAVGAVDQITGQGSALSIGGGAGAASGMLMGGAIAGMGIATGNPLLAAAGANQVANSSVAAMSPNSPGPSMASVGGSMALMYSMMRNGGKGQGGEAATTDDVSALVVDDHNSDPSPMIGGANVPASTGILGELDRGPRYGEMPKTSSRKPQINEHPAGAITDGPLVTGGNMAVGDSPEASTDKDQRSTKGEARKSAAKAAAVAATGTVLGSMTGNDSFSDLAKNKVVSLHRRTSDIQQWAGYVEEASTAGNVIAQQEVHDLGRRTFGPISNRLAAIAAEDAASIGTTSDLIDRYASYITKHHGEEETMEAFRSGKAHQQIAEKLPEDSPFQDPRNFGALADAVLEPQQSVGFDDMVHAMRSTKGSDDHLDTLATELGMPETFFHGADGTLRSIASTADEIGALEERDNGMTYLEEAAAMVAAGDHDSARDLLWEAAGNADIPDNVVDDLVGDLDVAAAYFNSPRMIPQSTEFAPGDIDGRVAYRDAHIHFNPNPAPVTHTAYDEEGPMPENMGVSRTPAPTIQVTEIAGDSPLTSESVGKPGYPLPPADGGGTLK